MPQALGAWNRMTLQLLPYIVSQCHSLGRLLAGTRPSQEHPTGQNELREQGHATSAQEGLELSIAQVTACWWMMFGPIVELVYNLIAHIGITVYVCICTIYYIL